MDMKSAPAGSGLSLDPQEVLHALKRRKWLIMASGLLVGAAVAAGTMRQPKIYSARAKITLDPSLPKVLGDDVALDDLSQRARTARVFNNTQYKTMTNRAVLEDVIKRLELTKNQDFLATYQLQNLEGEGLRKSALATLRQIVTIAPEKASRIVDVVVEDQDPHRAAKIANTLAQAYMDYTLERRLETTRKASSYLFKETEDYAAKLEAAEASLYEFQKKNELAAGSFENRQNMTATNLATLNAKDVEARTKLIELRAQKAVLQGLLHDPGAIIESMPEAASNPVLGELRTTVVTLKKTKAELGTRYGLKHPKMQELDEKIVDVQKQLNEETLRVVEGVTHQVEAQEALRAGLAKEIAAEKAKEKEQGGMALQYAKITRDYDVIKNRYNDLRNRQTGADLSGRLESNFVTWYEEALPVLSPVRPSVPRNAALGLLAGLVLGLLIALAGVVLDNTVHSQIDIEQYLKLPFLGVIPRIPDAAMKSRGSYSPDRDLYIVKNPKSALAECARSVRTNLIFMGTDKPLNRLLLTSAGPAEGKTTTAVNLAAAMAQAGNQVLLIDTDLRKPRLHRSFGVSGEVGLTSCLVDSSRLDDAIKSTEVVGLDILPCGPLPPNPAELLHSDRFRGLLDLLDKRYSRIILDSPPVGAVTDAAILSKWVDGSILVVQANKTTKDSVRRAYRRLYDVDANVVGAVLNDFDLESGTYGSQHYYYYQRYGYGDSEQEA